MDIFSAENLEIFYQLLVAVALGASIGAERRLAQKTAGMRTFALVSMGAALFTIISVVAFPEYVGKPGFDPSRIASQIVVGIGFLGAGLIIFHESKIRGLTTAAGLWVSAAIGMAIGYKLYAIAIFATILTLIIFLVLWLFEYRFLSKVPLQLHEHGDQDD
jgi:putative Mg2+ transporter-C (MgtC) family protein